MAILYVVATPIGNLGDITYRAVEILKTVGLIACEDTRHSKILLDKYQIKTPTVSYHQHSTINKIGYIINQLKSGKNVAIITDAGTPGISDPGSVLISEAVKNKIKVEPIPGSSAIITALSASGLPGHSFLFLGFLPKKKGRQTLFRNLMKASQLEIYDSVVIYESPYHLVRTLQDLQLVIGNKEVVVCRELTKKFEEIIRGQIHEVISHFQKQAPKGEFVIIMKVK